MSRAALAVLVAALLCGAAPAAARERPRPRAWATVNVCDTARHPDTIGLRASMPGSGRRGERMRMRFTVQYRRRGAWRDVPGAAGRSGWVRVGSARWRRREAGRSFRFAAPAPGARQVLRGVVTFQWRDGRHVRREVKRPTRGGHRSASGADPKGFSARRCVLTTPARTGAGRS